MTDPWALHTVDIPLRRKHRVRDKLAFKVLMVALLGSGICLAGRVSLIAWADESQDESQVGSQVGYQANSLSIDTAVPGTLASNVKLDELDVSAQSTPAVGAPTDGVATMDTSGWAMSVSPRWIEQPQDAASTWTKQWIQHQADGSTETIMVRPATVVGNDLAQTTRSEAQRFATESLPGATLAAVGYVDFPDGHRQGVISLSTSTDASRAVLVYVTMNATGATTLVVDTTVANWMAQAGLESAYINSLVR